VGKVFPGIFQENMFLGGKSIPGMFLGIFPGIISQFLR
jgi:hypothetical protein